MLYSQKDRRAKLKSLPRPLTGRSNRPPNLVYPGKHKHKWAQFSYPIQGHLEVWTHDARFIALPQCAVWIPAGVTHKVETFPNTIVRSLYLDTKALGINWEQCRMLTVSSLLHDLIREFSNYPMEYEIEGPQGRLAQVLVDQIVSCSEVGLVLPWPSSPELQKICTLMKNEPDTVPSLKSLSDKLGISEKTLTRRFQKETGLGFRLWRQRARLIFALPLLEKGMRVTDVAIACGYESLSSFTAAFREHTNMTPSQLTKSNK